MLQVKCEFTRMVPIGELRPHPKNPKKHSTEAIQRQAEVLEYQGWRRPITVSNRSGVMTAGHKRMLAAKKLGDKEVPVSFQDYESEEQEIADLVADNALNEWELTDLAAVNDLVGDLGPDFNIDMLGLKDFTLDVAEKDGGCDPDEVPENPPAITKPGDLYTLGNHRLLCGDSTKREDVERLMAGEKADMVFTDPPYGIGIDADYGKRMKGQEDFIKRANKSYSNIIGDDEEFDPSFILDYFGSKKVFLWGANNYTAKLPKGQWFVWYKKTTDGMKKMFGWDFELCWTNQTAGQVYEQAWAGCFGHNKKLDGDTKTHPSMKSVQLILQIFRDYEANSVIDLFLGSGSTLIACEKTNRRCFGMEIDPHYCDVIVARWEKFTGKKAILAGSGPSIDYNFGGVDVVIQPNRKLTGADWMAIGLKNA